MKNVKPEQHEPRAKRPIDLDIPVYITGMSFGALSYEAKTAPSAALRWLDQQLVRRRWDDPDERRYTGSGFTVYPVVGLIPTT